MSDPIQPGDRSLTQEFDDTLLAEKIPVEDLDLRGDELQPETQGVDPLEAELGGQGQGDLSPEDESTPMEPPAGPTGPSGPDPELPGQPGRPEPSPQPVPGRPGSPDPGPAEPAGPDPSEPLIPEPEEPTAPNPQEPPLPPQR